MRLPHQVQEAYMDHPDPHGTIIQYLGDVNWLMSASAGYFTSQPTASRRETGLLCESLLLQITSQASQQTVEEKQDCCVKVCFCRLLHKPAKYKTRREQLYSDTFCCFN
ncbi:hypothetical protein RRG08_042199 [Elysia crispata]|uniref:Uncharacterized protein n=1 Tax=Elysia crispata TaxID=231223 RepID=A0AAE1BEJ2_9GAST|nr:hypothetical protein RRG08_042199 [Elysia crispata]